METKELFLPEISEEEALRAIVSWINDNRNQEGYVGEDGQLLVYLAWIFNPFFDVQKQRPENSNSNQPSYRTNRQLNSSPFYDAAWNLCRRGVLRPASSPPQGSRDFSEIGACYAVTAYGWQWLAGLISNDAVPTENEHFSRLLSKYDTRFGEGYRSRSQEALGCYRAQLYLACCSMAGAAAESVLLSLAVAKKGETEALKIYQASSGRGKVESLLLANQNSYLREQLPIFTGLLKYWRDEAAHGNKSEIGESEAFTMLLLLMRFAQFADEKWNELTK